MVLDRARAAAWSSQGADSLYLYFVSYALSALWHAGKYLTFVSYWLERDLCRLWIEAQIVRRCRIRHCKLLILDISGTALCDSFQANAPAKRSNQSDTLTRHDMTPIGHIQLEFS